jgi:cell division protein FtsL
MVAYGAVLASGVLLYAWQHFHSLQLGYQLEELKAARTQAQELNQQLRLEVAALKSPLRIDAIARRDLGLTAPVPGQVAPVLPPLEAVLAQVAAASDASRR